MAVVALTATPATAQADRPDDPRLGEQRALEVLALPDAWATTTAEGVLIAVVDSGVDPTHPDLAAHLLDGGATEDGRGTGTHAAGVVAAVTDNGVGIAGAAPDARLLALDVLDDDGHTEADRLATGIAAAADAGAGVIALTLGGDAANLALLAEDDVLDAVRAAIEAGSVVVVGTDAGDDLPTDLPVVLVGTDDGDGLDPRVVTAPGDAVLGTAPLAASAAWPEGSDGYEALDGVGPATALVAGTAALVVAQGRTPEEVTDLLVGTAQNPQGDPALGAGRVDAAAAVAQAGSVAAGGGALPGTGTDGGLPPWAIGALALGAAVLTVVLTVALGRRPRA